MTAKITLFGAMFAITLCLKSEERNLKKEHTIVETRSTKYCHRNYEDIFSRVRKDD